jgi:hypothetical protein
MEMRVKLALQIPKKKGRSDVVLVGYTTPHSLRNSSVLLAAGKAHRERQVMVRRSRWIQLLAGSLALVASSSAPAHHSYAMFDQSKAVTSNAVVRLWQFSSPHAVLWVYINDAKGKPALWGLEAPGPGQLVRNGWKKDTVKPGDKVVVTVNPLHDGRNGGNLAKLVLADGRSMDMGGPPKRAPGSAPPAGGTKP